MPARTVKVTGIAVVFAAFATHAGWAQETSAPAETSGESVNVSAQLLKDAEDVALSAQELRPIALESLPAAIDPATAITPPGTEVSGLARTLRDLDPADIPATARTLGGTARGGLPGAASSRSTGGHSPSLPSAAQNRGRGRGRPGG